MSKSISKKVISLLIILGVLVTVMICQAVSAESEERLISPTINESICLNDYYPKTVKYTQDGNLVAEEDFNYTFCNDGSIDVEQNIVSPTNGYSQTSNYTVQKEYDINDRLVSFKTNFEDPYYNTSLVLCYDNEGSYIVNKVFSDDQILPQLTYDPEIKSYFAGGYTIEYDENGRKTKMSNTDTRYGTYDILFSYQTDPQTGKVVQKNYTIFEDGTQTESGSVDITYSGDLSIHTETIVTDEETITISDTFNRDNRLIKYVRDTRINDGEGYDNWRVIESTFSYDNAGNVITIEGLITNGDGDRTTILQEYTYEYHPHGAQAEMTATLTSEKGKDLLSKQYTNLSVQMENGETSDYLFKFIVYNNDSKQWYKLQDFGESTEFNWYTGPAGHKTLYVDIVDKEAYQTDHEKALKDKMRISLDDVSVTDSGLKVDTFESSEGTELAMKTHTTLTATASNGVGDLQYKFIVHNEDNGQWYKIQDFTPDNSCDWYTGPAGNKTLYVDVKDADGTVVRQGLSVTVQ